MLAAAMNPCPCGFWNDPTRECRCSPLQIQRYVGRISGPLLDRIDIHIDVPAVKFRELAGEDSSETDSSAVIRSRVINARERQLRRFNGEKIFSNSAMTPRMIRTHCQIDSESERMLESAMTRLGLSARAYDRILKVSRTIADLEGCEEITQPTSPKQWAIAHWTGLIGRELIRLAFFGPPHWPESALSSGDSKLQSTVFCNPAVQN